MDVCSGERAAGRKDKDMEEWRDQVTSEESQTKKFANVNYTGFLIRCPDTCGLPRSTRPRCYTVRVLWSVGWEFVV
jgi:hypothetical protein